MIASTTKNILAFDLDGGESLYGFGVLKKGDCRNLGINEERTRLVCAGEDESATLLTFR